MDADLTSRVRALTAKLEPKSSASRVRLLVTEMPWDYPCDQSLDFDKQEERQRHDVRALACDLVARPTVLQTFLPQLSRGDQRMAFCFGEAIAESSGDPLQWLEPMIAAVSEAPQPERNHSLLSGFIVGIANPLPDAVTVFKERAARSQELAPALPPICWRLGVTPSDVALVLTAFNAGLLHPFCLTWLHTGGALANVPAPFLGPLIDALLIHSPEGFAAAVELMGMYSHGMPDKLDGFRPQIRNAAASFTRWDTAWGHPAAEHHFEKIMMWMLDRGREDPDARATALILARALINVDGYHQIKPIRRVVPRLLSGFPEIAWPLIGRAIASHPRHTWHFRHLLGSLHSIDHRQAPPLLSLPEDVLFAWCQADPDSAPAFAASILPLVTTYQADSADRSIHPVMARMLDEFGNRADVLRAIDHNIGCYSWSGSMTEYYALYQHPMQGLLDHGRPEVSRWAERTLRRLDAQINHARNEHEEYTGWLEAC